MQKIYRLCGICLVMLCSGQIMSNETEATACPLFLKPAFELSEKDQVLLDILHQDVINSKGDFASLAEINGKYPQAFEQAFSCYVDSMKGQHATREKYKNAIKKSSEYLATLLFPVPTETPEVEERELTVSGGDCVSLLIGINYEGSRKPLSNCIRDIDHVFSVLLSPQFGIKHENVIYMSDRQKGTSFYPTRTNILRQIANFTNLVNQTKVGYIHYSGHGTSVADTSGDELDGYDEALLPVDYETNGVLLDDDMYTQLVRALDSDVQLLITTDCCHSGTILDLPYKWTADGRYTIEHNLSRTELNSLPQVVMLSGCKDDQTSADGGSLTVNNEDSGALTAAFLQVLKKYNYEITYRQLLVEVNSLLKANGFKQRPELTSSYLLNLDDYYMMHQRGAALR